MRSQVKWHLHHHQYSHHHYQRDNCDPVHINFSILPHLTSHCFSRIRVGGVSSSATQITIAAAIGLALMVVVVRLSRRGQLSFRYTVGWLAVASVGILGGLMIPLAEPVAEALGLSAAALLALIALVFFVLIAIQLSISISGLQKQNRALVEEVARLRHDVRTSSPRDS
jgi:hypothetical protein